MRSIPGARTVRAVIGAPQLAAADQPRGRRIAFAVGDWRVVYRAGGEQQMVQSGTLAGSPIFDSITGKAWVRVIVDGDAAKAPAWTSIDDIVDVF